MHAFTHLKVADGEEALVRAGRFEDGGGQLVEEGATELSEVEGPVAHPAALLHRHALPDHRLRLGVEVSTSTIKLYFRHHYRLVLMRVWALYIVFISLQTGPKPILVLVVIL